MKDVKLVQEAIEAQKVFNEFKNKGLTKRAIYLTHVTKKVHVSYNHFVKLLNVDTSDYERLVEEFKDSQRDIYNAYLKRRSQKRLK